MSKHFSLQPLIQLAQQKNDAATKRLGQLNHQHLSAQARLDALQQFRKDYQLRFQEAARNGMSSDDLKNYQDFIARLDQALKQQFAAIETAKASVQFGRTELMDTTRKMKSFDALAQRHAAAEKIRETKTEQRMQDEHSGRFAAYRTTEPSGDI